MNPTIQSLREDATAAFHAAVAAVQPADLLTNAVTIDGEVAEVQYDLLFGGTPTYTDLLGDAVLLDGVWMVTREMLCGMMTSARVGCP